MRWTISDRGDPAALPLADRHYNRQSIGSPQFVPTGSCKVFRHDKALWVTSWPKAEFVRHAWAGAWINSLFRNEGAGLSSELIREAIAATRFFWVPPPMGLITFVDASKVRHKRDPGRCYLRAGFTPAVCPRHGGSDPACMACQSRTQKGLLAFQLLPAQMPDPEQPLGVMRPLFEMVG